MKTLKINPLDNTAVIIEGNPQGHKIAVRDIKCGENIIKYGYPIGHATTDIKKGEHIHTHNCKTNLEKKIKYTYKPHIFDLPNVKKRSFFGYVRKNGCVGIRNEIWIISTVGCVNKICESIADKASEKNYCGCDGVFAYTHPFGCSQLGDDMLTTQKILKGLVNHPNAAGVLVVGLGCENNNISEFKKILGDFDPERVRFLQAQDESDEIASGIRITDELSKYAKKFKRTKCDLSKLTVGLKCGGSDGFSGLTANPLIGRVSDKLIASGSSAILTEVPEMFGAETILMNRCADRSIFDKTVRLINDFKSYFTSHNQVIYENPSPGNKDGGITTLEEKSLGCIQKSGFSIISDVIGIGDHIKGNGLYLLTGPGNDMVAVTNLTASGASLILFSTGRGTPLGAPVPTVKISTNSALAKKKPAWIDFDAGECINGADLSDKLIEYIIEIANGTKTNNEKNNFREISIFKDGVVL